MDYFLDTNVGIGYIFCNDPWHDLSVKVFTKSDNLHYSVNVVEELNRKYNSILTEQKQFFYSMRDELEMLINPFKKLSFEDLKSIGLSVNLTRDFDSNKKINILNVFWQYCLKKYDESNKIGIKYVIRSIKNWLFSFERLVLDRNLEFNRVVICSKKRIEEYSSIYEELCNVGVHDEDRDIVLDAHDLACDEYIKLFFVSSDKKLCNRAKKVKSLNICDFVSLEEF